MSDGIVLELQRDALCRDTDILELASKAYVVARKLKLKEFQEWLESERTGYATNKKVPNYRLICSYLKCYNPMRGWIDVISEDEDLIKRIQHFQMRDSLANLVALKELERGILCYYLDDKMNILLSDLTGTSQVGIAFKYALHIPRNTIINVLEQIRNTILDWALLLEEQNIIGKGLTFTLKEKQAAKDSIISSYTVNIFGNANNSQIQQNSSDSKQELLTSN